MQRFITRFAGATDVVDDPARFVVAFAPFRIEVPADEPCDDPMSFDPMLASMVQPGRLDALLR